MYKVDNAIILAAGRGSRLKHITEKCPKPLLKPRENVLIEDIIKKLMKKGITEIHVVTGYLKNNFNYLKNNFNVNLIYNKNWKNNNNITSLLAAKNFLSNTLILNGDIVMEKNLIKNEYDSAITYGENNEKIDEWIINVDKHENISEFVKNGINKRGVYQRELTFITSRISEVLKRSDLNVNLNDYYEDIVLNISKKIKEDFKVFKIKKELIYDLDSVADYEKYAK